MTNDLSYLTKNKNNNQCDFYKKLCLTLTYNIICPILSSNHMAVFIFVIDNCIFDKKKF